MLTPLMKTTLTLCCLLFAYSIGQSQYLKITHIGLGHGDCTFIIAQEKDGGPVYTVMIDILGTGEEAFNTVRYEFQTDTVLTKSGHRTIDYLIITHPHTDHFQGVNRFIQALKAYNKTAPSHQKINLDSYITPAQINLNVKTTLEKDGQIDCNGVITASDDDERMKRLRDDDGLSEEEARRQVQYENGIKMLALQRQGQTMKVHQALHTNSTKIKEQWDNQQKMWTKTMLALSQYTPKDIALGDDLFEQFTGGIVNMNCVVGKGQTINAAEPFLTKNTGPFGTTYFTKNPNDLSVGFLINCEAFTYLTMGDLAGVNGSAYRDGETGVANALTQLLPVDKGDADFHICALKLGHHGSEHSTKADFCSTLQPVLGFVPAAGKPFSGTRLPHQTAVTNFQNGPKAKSLLYTFQPTHYTQSTTSYDGFDAAFCSNDIAILQDIQLIVSHPSKSVDYPEEIPLTIGYRTRNYKDRKLNNGPKFIPFTATEKGKNLTACDVDHRWSKYYIVKK